MNIFNKLPIFNRKMSDFWKLFIYFSIFPFLPMLYSRIYIHRREEEFIFIFLISLLYLVPYKFGIIKTKSYALIVGISLFVFGIIDLAHSFIFKGPINKQIFYIIFDTNISETKSFLSDFIQLEMIVGILFYVFLYFFFTIKIFSKQTFEISTDKKLKYSVFIILPFVIKAIDYKFSMKKVLDVYALSNQPLNALISYLNYREQMDIINDSKKEAEIIKLDITKNDNPESETHVLLIGESLSQSHMSLYGYKRNTNPKLLSIKDELFVFKNVQCTDPPSTLANLQKVFTMHTSDAEDFSGLKISILDILNQAGYKTYWLSNQGILGKNTSMTTALSQKAHKRFFTSTTHRYDLDEKLFKPIQNILEEKTVHKKFIVVHLQGNHNTYSHRYTADYAKFNNEPSPYQRDYHDKRKVDQINEYDNSVLYNDNFVYTLISKLKRLEGQVSMIYFPDHGEEIYYSVDRQGHGNIGFPTESLFQIPFLFWQNENFKDYRNLKDKNYYINRKYTIDHVIHSLMDLYEISSSLYDSEKSIFSDNFVDMKLPYKGKNE